MCSLNMTNLWHKSDVSGDLNTMQVNQNHYYHCNMLLKNQNKTRQWGRFLVDFWPTFKKNVEDGNRYSVLQIDSFQQEIL